MVMRIRISSVHWLLRFTTHLHLFLIQQLREPGYIYTRIGNPSCVAVEQKVAKLEGGEAAIATSSGMGAITATIWTCINGGEEIIADKTLYGCTFEFFEHHLSRFGVKVRFIDITSEHISGTYQTVDRT